MNGQELSAIDLAFLGGVLVGVVLGCIISNFLNAHTDEICDALDRWSAKMKKLNCEHNSIKTKYTQLGSYSECDECGQVF